MKKNFSLSLLTLFLMFFSFVIFPVKVFASETLTREAWFNYISQFEFGFAKGEIDSTTGDILIVEEPGHEYEGYLIFCRGNTVCFEPDLAIIQELVYNEQDIVWYLEENFENFDGYLYWNFEEGYWQIDYYDTSELGYYEQRIEELENEIQELEDEIQQLEDEKQQLEDEIQQLEDEIQRLEDENQQLEDEIQQLEDEIQQLEDALDLEYDRGYNEGYEIGYNEGLLENNDIDITKWFVPLIVIIIVVGIIEPIILSKRRG